MWGKRLYPTMLNCNQSPISLVWGLWGWFWLGGGFLARWTVIVGSWQDSNLLKWLLTAVCSLFFLLPLLHSSSLQDSTTACRSLRPGQRDGRTRSDGWEPTCLQQRKSRGGIWPQQASQILTGLSCPLHVPQREKESWQATQGSSQGVDVQISSLGPALVKPL